MATAPDAAFMRGLFELRRIIEPEAAALAALRATPEALVDIEKCLAIMAKFKTESLHSVRADVSFHTAILVASGNEFLAAFGPAIRTALTLAFTLQRGVCPTPDHFVPNHRKILNAICRGDAEAARAAVRKLLLQAEAQATASLKQSGE